MKAGVVSSRTAKSLSIRPNLATLCIVAALVPVAIAQAAEAEIEGNLDNTGAE